MNMQTDSHPAAGEELLPEGFRALWAEVHRQLPGHDDPAAAAQRAAAFAAADSLGLPNRRVEDWKFTSSHPLARIVPQVAAPDADMGDWTDRLAGWPLDGAAVLALLDGAWCPDLGRGALPDGVSLTRLSQAPAGLAELLKPLPGGAEATVPNLVQAFAGEGLLIEVAAGAAPAQPLVVLHLSSGAVPVHHLRHRLRLGEGAALTVVELHLSAADRSCWTNLLTDVELAPQARLSHLRIGGGKGHALRTAFLRGRLSAAAAYEGTAIALGGDLVRDEIDIRLAGEGASCRLDGLNLAAGRDHLDSTLRVAHDAAHCSSNQHYRAVANDHGHAVFQGRIAVAPGAQKSDAHQLHRALLLSDEAVADAKPELEILADDVACSHGASIGDLDEDALFYLRARGIGAGAARNLLIDAFAAEIVEGIADPAWRAAAGDSLQRRLHRMVETSDE